MTTYNVYIEAVEHLFYSGNFEVEAETEEEAIEKASNEFYLTHHLIWTMQTVQLLRLAIFKNNIYSRPAMFSLFRMAGHFCTQTLYDF